MKNYRKEMIKEIKGLADKACKSRGVSLATISKEATQDARFLGNIFNGGNFTIRRFEETVSNLRGIVERKKE